MTNPLTLKSWSPYAVGVGIGLLSWFAFATADHPLGITTAFEHTAALTEKAVVPGVEQTNGYFAAKAAEGKSPKIGWEWMLVRRACSSGRSSVRGSPATARREPCPPSGGGGSAAVRASGWSSRSWPGR